MSAPESPTGALLVVATPIGNLADLSQRAREALASCDAIACEDTRVAGRLIKACELPARPLLACQEHNERDLAPRLAERIAGGETLALLSDSGTPAISDPGFRLVRECRRRKLAVTPIPGPCALIAALSTSGLPTHAFSFDGFLPPKSAARRRFLLAHRQADRTAVLYESPHRIGKLLDEAVEVLGPEHCLCVARELTKKFETIVAGPAAEVRERVLAHPVKGEFVVCLAPAGFSL